MNKLKLISTMVLLLVFSCKQDKEAVCDIKAEKQVIKLMLQKYIIANEAGNLAMIDEIWANDSSVYSIGTDRHDVFVGFDALRNKFSEQFQRFENTLISSRDLVIYVHPRCETAWFSEVLQYNYTQGPKAKEYPDLRFTGFLEKRAGKWVIIQTHLSAPDDK